MKDVFLPLILYKTCSHTWLVFPRHHFCEHIQYNACAFSKCFQLALQPLQQLSIPQILLSSLSTILSNITVFDFSSHISVPLVLLLLILLLFFLAQSLLTYYMHHTVSVFYVVVFYMSLSVILPSFIVDFPVHFFTTVMGWEFLMSPY